MLKSLKDLESYSVHAFDGDIGKVSNFLIDENSWMVRYLVVQTSNAVSMEGRDVLISPISFSKIDEADEQFNLVLTMEKIKDSPNIDAGKPISHQHELAFHRYYDYPRYWGDKGLWGAGTSPYKLATGRWNDELENGSQKTPRSIHLRSDEEVRGYHIQGSDEEIGHVEDFIIDDLTWEVRFLVVDTSNWWFGKKVLVAPQWAKRISQEENKVYVGMSRQEIKDSPEWDAAAVIDEEYVARLNAHYKRPAHQANKDLSAARPPAPPANPPGRSNQQNKLPTDSRQASAGTPKGGTSLK